MGHGSEKLQAETYRPGPKWQRTTEDDLQTIGLSWKDSREIVIVLPVVLQARGRTKFKAIQHSTKPCTEPKSMPVER